MAIPVLLFVIALAVRVVVTVLFADPAYPDAFYYANVARELAAGGGLSVDYIWNFVEVGGTLPEKGALPIPANAHWMPLAVVVQVPFIWALGPTELASMLPFWLAAAAAAPLTYFIARDAGLLTWQSAAAGLLAAVPGGVTPFLGQPDNFALFMLLGGLALWLCARGLRGHRGAFAAGGLVVGLAFLSRNDGVLLGLPFALAFLYDLLRAPRLSRIGWWPAIACAAGFVLVASPWLLRQLDVFGSISPSSSGGRILFITEYRELYSVSSETTLASFLGQGLPSLVESRLMGLGQALLIFATSPMLAILVPFLLLGGWLRRRSPEFAPWFVYALSLFLFTAIVSAVHAPYGTFLHSAVALLPHAYPLAIVGITAVVAWIAARRPNWDAPRASRNISFMFVAVFVAVSAFATLKVSHAWGEERDNRSEVLAALATEADPLPVVEEALRLYDVRWLALEGDHITSFLWPVLDGETQPEWLSEPLVLLPPPPSVEREPDEVPVPRAALYAVCLEPDDERCDR